MSISPEDIQKIAKLSHLQLEKDKTEKLGQDINNILSFVDQLQAADTSNIEPMAHPMDAEQILRADVVSEHDQREKLAKNAPAIEDGLFLVPRVIE
jgi:aspartyl-tRNA(Asn)/glutamyl-tRNA(Gln) amidotransferase subunit C